MFSIFQLRWHRDVTDAVAVAVRIHFDVSQQILGGPLLLDCWLFLPGAGEARDPISPSIFPLWLRRVEALDLYDSCRVRN